MHTPIIERVVKQMETLPEVKQKQVLEFIEKLKGFPRGVPGKELLRFAGVISPEDIALMDKAIAEDCERADPNEW